jgi:sec-independent protein translocase protein TatA
MGSLGVPEIAFIFILALLIFGPKRLPELGRTVGKGLSEFRKASNDLKRTINSELALEETPAPPQQLTRRVPTGTIAAPLGRVVGPREAPAETPAETPEAVADADDAPSDDAQTAPAAQPERPADPS